MTKKKLLKYLQRALYLTDYRLVSSYKSNLSNSKYFYFSYEGSTHPKIPKLVIRISDHKNKASFAAADINIVKNQLQNKKELGDIETQFLNCAKRLFDGTNFDAK